MSFGFSVSDFITVGSLAWKVYKGCKSAPESFGQLCDELSSLRAVIEEVQETIQAEQLSAAKQARLKQLSDGCHAVLKDLENLLEKYDGLDTQSRRTWDRMKWAQNDVVEIRGRMTFHMASLNVWVSTSQCTVQQKLDKFLRDFQNGGREGSVVSGQTAESLAPDQVATWRAIRKELEEIGITVAAFDSNREFIFTWFMRSVESGAFEEQGGEDSQSVAVPERLPSSPPDVPGPPSAQSDTSQTALHLTGIESDVAHHVPVGGGIDLPITVSRASTSGSPSPSASTNPDVRASNHSNRLSPAQRKRPVPRVVALFSKLYSPERSFRRSIKEDDPLRRILEDFPGLVEGDSRKELKRAIENVETETIHMLLQYEFDADQTTSCDGMSLLAFASYHRQSGFVRFLWDNGADVNASTSRFLYPTALLAASAWGRQEIVQLLLDKGADVNVQGGDDGTALQAASSHGHREIVQSLLDKGADVNAQGGRYGTALQAASAWRRPGIVQLLLDNGANVNAQGGRHGTALQAASTRGYREIVQLLRENGAR